MASSDTTPSKKRKRVVTACSECHRRKQKCNREKPCNFCIARNVTDQCSYDQLPQRNEKVTKQLKIAPRAPTKLTTQHDDDTLDLTSKEPDISAQMGYSTVDMRNTFASLSKALESENGPPTSNSRAKLKRQSALMEKYLTLVSQLPEPNITQNLIEIYFSQVDSFFAMFERPLFDQMHTSWLKAMKGLSKPGGFQQFSRQLQHFSALVFQILAVALQFVDQDSDCAKLLDLPDLDACDMLSQKYSGIGMQIMSLLGRTNTTIAAVQHDLLRGRWLKNYSRGTEAWYVLGGAIRQAQDLGLHLHNDVVREKSEDSRQTNLKLWNEEYNRRLWSTIYIWDSHMALILGRPRTINPHDCTVESPIDCDMPEDPSTSPPKSNRHNNQPTRFRQHLFSLEIGHIIHEMFTTAKQKVNNPELVFEIHHKIDALLEGLNPALRPKNPDTTWDKSCPHIPRQRNHILMIANFVLMALHRDHAHTHPESQRAALDAALTSLAAQQQIFSLMGASSYRIYGMSCYSLDAGLFLTALMFSEKTQLDKPTQIAVCQTLSETIVRLKVMQERSALAKNGFQLLSRCYQKITQDILNHDESSTSSETTPTLPSDFSSTWQTGKYSYELDNLDDRFNPDMFEEVAQLDLFPEDPFTFENMDQLAPPWDLTFTDLDAGIDWAATVSKF